MEDVTFNKRKMKELEDNLLYKLSATRGSVSKSTITTILKGKLGSCSIQPFHTEIDLFI